MRPCADAPGTVVRNGGHLWCKKWQCATCYSFRDQGQDIRIPILELKWSGLPVRAMTNSLCAGKVESKNSHEH
jgi:uncharacterized protein YdeI (BOF family)